MCTGEFVSRTVSVVGRMLVLKDVYVHLSRTCEYVLFLGTRDFAEVIKVKDLEMRLY